MYAPRRWPPRLRRRVHVRPGELLGLAHAERQRLGRMIQFAEPDTWESRAPPTGWWNRDVVAHLGACDTAAAQLFAGEPAEELEEYRAALGDGPFDIDGFNAWSVDRRSGLATREVLDTWGRAADAVLAYAAAAHARDWRDAATRGSRATIAAALPGPVAGRGVVPARRGHARHERLRGAAAWQHWPVHLTIDMAVRMLPWALARAGSTCPAEPADRGRGRRRGLVALGPRPRRGARAARRSPTSTINGAAPQFALVAGRRLDADEALDAGTVVLGGDRRLAETVLRDPRIPLGRRVWRSARRHEPFHRARHRTEPVLVRVVALQQVERRAPLLDRDPDVLAHQDHAGASPPHARSNAEL